MLLKIKVKTLDKLIKSNGKRLRIDNMFIYT
jgi:hypothetical protein